MTAGSDLKMPADRANGRARDLIKSSEANKIHNGTGTDIPKVALQAANAKRSSNLPACQMAKTLSMA